MQLPFTSDTLEGVNSSLEQGPRQGPPPWRKTVLAGLAGLYLLWAGAFIGRSSFIALDGARYFCLFDDAMISMRYAQNLAHGTGLVWAAGERVEGYSNFLMVLIMAACNALFGNTGAVLAVQILGAALMLGIAWTVLRILEALRGNEGGPVSDWIPVLGFAGTLAYYPLNYWSLMGMETGLLTLLLFLAVRFSVEHGRDPSGRRGRVCLYGMAICMGLAFLTRIDSLIFGLPMGLYVLSNLGRLRPALSDLRGPALVFGMLVGSHEVFRYLYYGQWLPNTFTLKLTGMPLGYRIRDGWEFVQPFLRESKAPLLLGLFALAFAPRKPKLYLAALGTLGLAYQIWNGGDPWNYWRMMAPGMPLVFALGLLGLEGLARRVLPARLGSLGATLVAVVLVLIVWKANHRFRLEWSLREPAKYAGSHANLVNAGLALAAVTDSTATLGVFFAGTPPYFAERDGVDFLGKNDAHIARLDPDTSGKVSWNGMRSVPGHNKYDLNFSIKTLLPTYVEGFRWGSQNLESWAKDHYVTFYYKGVRLSLLKDSPAVRWEKADSLLYWHDKEALPSW